MDFANKAPMADQQSASRMTEEMAQPKAPMTVEAVTLKPTANGGVIATCSKRRESEEGEMGPGGYSSKDYAFGSVREALAFTAQELGAAPAPTEAAAVPGLEPDDEGY